MSTVELARSEMRWSLEPSTKCVWTLGKRCLCSTSVALRLPADSDACTPIVKRPISPRDRILNRAAIASDSSIIRCAASRNSCPSMVGFVPPFVRLKRAEPN